MNLQTDFYPRFSFVGRWYYFLFLFSLFVLHDQHVVVMAEETKHLESDAFVGEATFGEDGIAIVSIPVLKKGANWKSIKSATKKVESLKSANHRQLSPINSLSKVRSQHILFLFSNKTKHTQIFTNTISFKGKCKKGTV